MVLNPIIDISYIIIGGILLIILTAWTYWRVSVNLKTSKRITLLACRTAAVLALIIILLQPSRQNRSELPKIEQKTAVLIDSSMSMKQTDAEGQRRFDYARNLLKDKLNLKEVDLFQFNSSAEKISPEDLDNIEPDKTDTRFHKSLSNLISNYSEYSLKQIVMLTDGHDFEEIPPQQTARLVQNSHASIYALPIGGMGQVRDLSILLSASQDFTFINQNLKLTADIRASGCQFSEVNVELWKEGQKLQTKKLVIEDKKEYSIDFTDTHPKAGCLEYEVRMTVLDAEVDALNNRSLTYVNFIDKKIKALLLEGQPHWDSTFLRRFLTQSERVDLDAMVQFTKEKVQTYRSDGNKAALIFPSKLEEISRYDLILLGKAVDQLLNETQIELLHSYVKDYGGSILFTRGNAFSNTDDKNSIQPVLWDEEGYDGINIVATDEGRRLSLFRKIDSLNKEGAQVELPDLEVSRKVAARKPLAVNLATSKDEIDLADSPAVVYRRTGRGQVMSFGVEGIWRWRFHQNYDKENDHFGALWDQCFLWLIHNSTFMPGSEYTYRIDSNNCRLGEKVNFTCNIRSKSNIDKGPYRIEVKSENGTKYTLELSNKESNNEHRFTASFTPPQPGKYTAEINAGGKAMLTKFIVSQDLLEEKEVALDKEYLQTLCQASGGKLISADELKNIHSFHKVNTEEIPQERVKLTAAWDKIWFIYLICILLASDWYLRRKWGLC